MYLVQVTHYRKQCELIRNLFILPSSLAVIELGANRFATPRPEIKTKSPRRCLHYKSSPTRLEHILYRITTHFIHSQTMHHDHDQRSKLLLLLLLLHPNRLPGRRHQRCEYISFWFLAHKTQFLISRKTIPACITGTVSENQTTR